MRHILLWREHFQNASRGMASEVLVPSEAERQATARSVVDQACELIELRDDGTWLARKFLHGRPASEYEGRHL